MKSAVRSITMRQQWLAKQLNGHLEKWLFCVQWGGKNLLEIFQHTLWCHSHTSFSWLTITKACAIPTNSNAHMLTVSSKVIQVHARHTLQIRTPSKCIEVVLSKAVHQHGYHCFLSSSVTFFLFIAVQRSDTTADSEVDFSPPGV